MKPRLAVADAVTKLALAYGTEHEPSAKFYLAAQVVIAHAAGVKPVSKETK